MLKIDLVLQQLLPFPDVLLNEIRLYSENTRKEMKTIFAQFHKWTLWDTGKRCNFQYILETESIHDILFMKLSKHLCWKKWFNGQIPAVQNVLEMWFKNEKEHYVHMSCQISKSDVEKCKTQIRALLALVPGYLFPFSWYGKKIRKTFSKKRVAATKDFMSRFFSCEGQEKSENSFLFREHCSWYSFCGQRSFEVASQKHMISRK